MASETIGVRPAAVRVVLQTVLGTLAFNFLVIVLVVGTVNPLGGLWGHWFPTVTPVSRHRKLQLFAAWNRQAPVQALIMGSSRSLKLEPREFSRATGLRYFNFAVTDGRLEDVKAILDFVTERGSPIRQVVLGIDPTDLQDLPLPAELVRDWDLSWRVTGRRPTLSWKVSHGAALLGEALTPGNAHEVGTSIMAAIERKEPTHFFHDDGTVEYPIRDRLIAAGRYDRQAAVKRCVDFFIDSLRARPAFDRGRIALLDSILDRARARDIQMVLWLTPHHPDFYAAAAHYEPVEGWLRALPDTIRQVAARHGAPFVDLHDIADFGGDPTDYYDCAHYGSANAARIAARLLAVANSASAGRTAEVRRYSNRSDSNGPTFAARRAGR